MTLDGSSPQTQCTSPLSSTTFQLSDANGSLLTTGIQRQLPRGAIHDLPQRVADFFATHRTGPALLAGALPFDRDQADFLVQPVQAQQYPAFPDRDHSSKLRTTDTALSVPKPWRVVAQPAPQDYASSVAAAIRLMDQTTDCAERKIVLARSLLVEATRRIDPATLWHRLAQDQSITTFMTPLPSATPDDNAMLVGATPELLLKKTADVVLSHPLAGSAPRQREASDDQQIAACLLRSEKDLREHRNVVEAILDTLTPYCKTLRAPKTPSLRSTASMWHLGTRIEGVLHSPDTSCVELLRDLHPTPAVCGTPREWARDMISRLESIDRGFFAGAVGWTEADGDGTWYVAIRCAELRGSQARLFAGAGIVRGSDPAAETAETAAKFAAMLRALQLEDITLEQTSSVA